MINQQKQFNRTNLEKKTKKYVCCLRTKQYCEHI